MTPDELIHIASRRAVHLEGYKQSEVDRMLRDLRRHEKKLVQQIAVAGPVADMSNSKLKALLADVRKAQLELLSDSVKKHVMELTELAKDEQDFEAEAITDIGKLDANEVRLARSAARAMKVAASRPLSSSGELLQPFLDGMSKRMTDRIDGQIRIGYTQGETNGRIIQRLVGTRANNFKDGVGAINRRDAEAVVRTSVQHTANAARNALWEANPDVVTGYKWVSTLDGRTSSQCQALDGQRFDIGKGPLPPIHIRCRSTTVADLNDGLDFLDEGATRAAKGGPVDADETYYDWLKKQDPKFIEDTIGPTRAKLLLDGGLSSEEFRKLSLDKNFQPMTLDQMKAKKPLAFAKAEGQSDDVLYSLSPEQKTELDSRQTQPVTKFKVGKSGTASAGRREAANKYLASNPGASIDDVIKNTTYSRGDLLFDFERGNITFPEEAPTKKVAKKIAKKIAKKVTRISAPKNSVLKTVDIGLDGGDYTVEAKEGIAAIDKVHGDGTMGASKVTMSRGIRAAGTNTPGGNSDIEGVYRIKTDEIEMNVGAYSASTARVVFVHEYGHKIDYKGVTPKTYKDRMSVVNALKDTDTFRQIQKNPTAYNKYLASDRELFARGYAQYIAKRSGDKAMTEYMSDKIEDRRFIKGGGLEQWEDKEFEPVMKHYDNLFNKLGWEVKR